MARGRLLKTKVKEARKIAEATTQGKLKAEQKAKQKKPFMLSLREHIDKLADRITLDDGMRLGAVVALTFLIKHGIDWAQTIPEQMAKKAASMPFPFGLGTGEITERGVPFIVGDDTEALEWVISYTIAYLMVDNFGEILTAGMDLLSTAKTLALFTGA